MPRLRVGLTPACIHGQEKSAHTNVSGKECTTQRTTCHYAVLLLIDPLPAKVGENEVALSLGMYAFPHAVVEGLV